LRFDEVGKSGPLRVAWSGSRWTYAQFSIKHPHHKRLPDACIQQEISLMSEISALDSYRFSFDVDEAREDYGSNRLIEFNKPYASPLWQNPP
jgi:hypothetical protein